MDRLTQGQLLDDCGKRVLSSGREVGQYEERTDGLHRQGKVGRERTHVYLKEQRNRGE